MFAGWAATGASGGNNPTPHFHRRSNPPNMTPQMTPKTQNWNHEHHPDQTKVENVWAGTVDGTLSSCVGCDIVQADHAPDAGVAQEIFHGILVRHHGKIQEEVEERLEDEVERHKEEENTQEQVRMPMTMDGNEDTQTRLEPRVTCDHICAMHVQTVRGVLRTAHCTRQCALWCSCNLSQCAQSC